MAVSESADNTPGRERIEQKLPTNTLRKRLVTNEGATD
jgi:hypothetical protein